MPGSTRRASGTPRGYIGSASSFSTPIHSDWIRRGRPSFWNVPAGGVATSAISTDLSGAATSSSCGSACRRSGSQTSAFSVWEVKRIFTLDGSIRPEESVMRFLALLFAAALSSGAAAQDWPKQRPIHIVVGFAPASTTDLVARLVAPKLADALGQSVLVDNRPGAAGNVAPPPPTPPRATPPGATPGCGIWGR